jgi:type IV pilus assembly protein PilY1
VNPRKQTYFFLVQKDFTMNAINGRKQACPAWGMRHARKHAALAGLALLLAGGLLSPPPALAQSGSPTPLADQPVFTYSLPGNLAFVISNEYPTNEDDANWGNYSDLINYGGYFDPNKCYVYKLNLPQPGQSYFKPVTHAGGPNKHFCDIASLGASSSTFPSASGSSGLWSGNLLNWSTMQTIDPVRSVLTGGYRVVDRASDNDPRDPMPDGSTGPGTPLTILEKAWNDNYYYVRPSSQIRGTQLMQSWWSDYAVQYTLTTDMVGKLTPFGNWVNGKWKRTPRGSSSGEPDQNSPTIAGGFYTFMKGAGNRMIFSPVDPTLWYPLDLPTLWDPNNQTVSAGYLDLLNVGWDNTSDIKYYWDTPYADNVKPPAKWASKPSATNPVWSFGTEPTYNPLKTGGAYKDGVSSCSGQNNPYPCYQVYVRVSVCDDSLGLDGKSLLEANCVLYPSPSPHYKPEGLFQKYANQLRYSVLSYPYGGDYALLRTPMRFIGQSVPNANPTITPATNQNPEWDAGTGVIPVNPNPAMNMGDAANSLSNQYSPEDWPTKLRSYNLNYPTDAGKQSGLINFINKYGQYYGYRDDDPYRVIDRIDFLYYATLRYFRNQGNPWPGFAPGVRDADSFPYVRTWSDPILNRCQKNFILGISDAHTWDGDAASLDAGSGNKKAVTTWTNRVGDMEGIRTGWPANGGNRPSLAWPRWDGGGTMGTSSYYYTAGMAYYMHTNDIRPDLPALGKANGKTTVDTYWVDATEFNAIEHLNPYMLAAKYGGFEVPAGFDPATYASALPQSWWNTTGDQMLTHLRGDPTSFSSTPMTSGTLVPPTTSGAQGSGSAAVPCGTQGVSCWQTLNRGSYPRPDNYYTAADSSKMVAGFQKAFANMVSSINAYSTAFALSSSTVGAAGGPAYSARYSPAAWTGTVFGGSMTLTPGAGTAVPVSIAQAWNTDGVMSTQLRTQPASIFFDGTNAVPVPEYFGWRDNRRVATWNGRAGTPLRWGNLSGAQQGALYPLNYGGQSVTLPNGGADYVNYLRGDKTNEVSANIAGGANALRMRSLPLGDIVNSSLLIVGAPQMTLGDERNPGYAAFKSSAANRTRMVYFGANDGMLHAINGDLTAGGNGGTEAFAYVPSNLFNTLPASAPGGGATTPNTPLAWLGNPNYVHRFMVDATPVAFDVDFDRTSGATAAAGASDWHTIVVGGLGKGGKGDNSFYALDVTDPDGMAASEDATASKVLWEFPAPAMGKAAAMGYSYGAPIIVKTAKHGWVVALTSGYDNADGYGHLFLVNPKTGALLEDIKTPGPSNGLAQASAFIADYTNYQADAIYAGDLDGQLWRFDLTSLDAPPQATLLARLTDPTGAAQPVTTWPLIEIDPTTNRRFVLVGTGRLLDASDAVSTQVQDFYAIIDGSTNAFKAVATPITRADLTPLTDVTAPPATITGGWYLDLGKNANTNYIPSGANTQASASATGERVVAQTLSAYSGIITFSTDLMTTDACIPAVSNAYAIYFGSGKTAFANGAAYLPETNHVTTTRVVVTAGGKMQWLVGKSNGDIDSGDLPSVQSGGVRLLNWRSVPVTGN